MVLVFGLILSGFVLGVVAVVALEAFGVFLIIKRLGEKAKIDESKLASTRGSGDHDHRQALDFAFKKQGLVWVLESDKIPKSWLDKPPKEHKRKKGFLEVFPVKKYGKIKDQSLILEDTGGSSNTPIQLNGCMVEAVSSTSLITRKWAKRFPIKLESKNSVIYNRSKTLYLYLDTSWEKESWCRALRLASYDDKGKIDWFSKLHDDFHKYLTSLAMGYPSFMKSSGGYYAEPSIDRARKIDASSSKVRQLWKRISRKASRNGADNRSTWVSLSAHEERKITERFCRSQSHHATCSTGFGKTAFTAKGPEISNEENIIQESSSRLCHSGSQSHISVITNTESVENLGVDEGTLCFNLLISRMFFDFKGNMQMKRLVQARVQRTLSDMRTPSYIGEVICKDIDLGNLPPFISGMRVLSMEMNEVWALEVDIEYSGGALLEIETRLEVCEIDSCRGIMDSNLESSAADDFSSDLLRGFENFGKQLNLTEGNTNVLEPKGENQNGDGLKSTTSASPSLTNGSRWKSILGSIAKQVSQVPLSVSIRVASVRGTLRLRIKSPPSDQLWYSFTSMPDIDFNLESSVGDHKINSGRVALFLINRLKAAIQENLVLPNCDNVTIPWMLAEKNDWIPRGTSPFIWINQEPGNDTCAGDASGQHLSEANIRTEAGMGVSSHGLLKQRKLKLAEDGEKQTCKSVGSLSHSISNISPAMNSVSLNESRTPLLWSDKSQARVEPRMDDVFEPQPPSRSVSLTENKTLGMDLEDGAKPKRMGRKERMLDLRKKMGEKFEEKKRHIEAKRRHFVEKMRGPREVQT